MLTLRYMRYTGLTVALKGGTRFAANAHVGSLVTLLIGLV